MKKQRLPAMLKDSNLTRPEGVLGLAWRFPTGIGSLVVSGRRAMIDHSAQRSAPDHECIDL